jgi:hypothetical protein
MAKSQRGGEGRGENNVVSRRGGEDLSAAPPVLFVCRQGARRYEEVVEIGGFLALPRAHWPSSQISRSQRNGEYGPRKLKSVVPSVQPLLQERCDFNVLVVKAERWAQQIFPGESLCRPYSPCYKDDRLAVGVSVSAT